MRFFIYNLFIKNFHLFPASLFPPPPHLPLPPPSSISSLKSSQCFLPCGKSKVLPLPPGLGR